MTSTQAKAYNRATALFDENFNHMILVVVHHQDGNYKLQVATKGTDEQLRDMYKQLAGEIEKIITMGKEAEVPRAPEPDDRPMGPPPPSEVNCSRIIKPPGF